MLLGYRRCLIPADGFYEWKKIGPKQKQAYNFGAFDGSVFAFAGLWDRWRQPDDTDIGHGFQQDAKWNGPRMSWLTGGNDPAFSCRALAATLVVPAG